jgi:hypothetical protein
MTEQGEHHYPGCLSGIYAYPSGPGSRCKWQCHNDTGGPPGLQTSPGGKWVEFYVLNQLQAALPPDLRRVINLQPMHTLDLDTAVCLATIKLCSKDETRGTSRIQAVKQEEEEDNVEAVSQNRQKTFYPQNQQNRGQQGSQNFRP